ncbi:MAG: hypothetical protein GY754_18440 [bacterium]|nr:hypothetical protein [bacterium]
MKLGILLFKQIIFLAVIFGLWPYVFFIERYLLRTRYLDVECDNLPPEFDGFTIAVISDVHYGFLTPKWWIKMVIKKANKTGANVIAAVGDYVKRPSLGDFQVHGIWPLLMKLEASDGVYMVLGNHDHWANSSLSLRYLEESGKSLRFGQTYIRKGDAAISLSGAGDNWTERSGIDETLKDVPSDIFRIVLAHNPDTADDRYSSRVDLFVSGHTHGGQVRIPGLDNSFLIPIKNKGYTCGFKHNRKGEKIFISRGLGWSVWPIRFNCSPELPVLRLRKKS